MKNNLRKKVLMGICTAAFMSQQVLAYAGSIVQSEQSVQMPMNGKEEGFANKLSSSAKDAFMKMNHEGRSMAMTIANHECKGHNSCKGQGGCKSDANSCKGQNACKGQGTCKVAANDAVNMAQKRAGA
jgi:hypothetical protein